MTPQERYKLEQELTKLENIDLPKALEDIQSIIGQGKISDNMNAWDAVQEKKDFIEHRINKVRLQLQNADVEITSNNDFYFQNTQRADHTKTETSTNNDDSEDRQHSHWRSYKEILSTNTYDPQETQDIKHADMNDSFEEPAPPSLHAYSDPSQNIITPFERPVPPYYNMQDLEMHLSTLYLIEKNIHYVQELKKAGCMAIGITNGFHTISDNKIKVLTCEQIYLIGKWEGIENQIGKKRALTLVERYRKLRIQTIEKINVKFFQDHSDIHTILK